MGVVARAAPLSQRLPPSRWKVRAGRVVAFASRSPIVDLSLKDGTRIFLDARSRTEAEAVWNGTFETHTVEILRRCLPAAGALLDVGANVGLIALPLARVLARTGGRVIAVEPIAANSARIRASALLNDVEVVVLPFALGDRRARVTMLQENRLGASTGNAVLAEGGATLPSIAREVEMLPLDDLASEVGHVDAVKLDVEGSEVLFLRGALTYLGEHRPVILGEFNSALMPHFGHTFVDVGTICQELRYRVVAFADEFVPVVVKPRAGIGDVLLVPEERLDATLRAVADAPNNPGAPAAEP